MKPKVAPWVQSFDGGKIWLPVNGLPSDFSELTLLALSEQMARVNRFGGATRKPYNLAQHSCLVADAVAWRLSSEGVDPQTVILGELFGLMHDAAELYTGDMAGPLKANLDPAALGHFRSLERDIDAALAAWAGLPSSMSNQIGAAIKGADWFVCRWEARDVLASPPRDGWHKVGEPLPADTLRPLSVAASARGFRQHFRAIVRSLPAVQKRARMAKSAWAKGAPAR